MTTPKRMTFKTLALLGVAILALAGCANKDGGTGVTTGRMGRFQNGAAITGTNQLPGIIGGGDQNSFQYAVAGLVSAQIDENALGYVSASGSGGTGVFFGGRVTVQGNTIGANSQLVIGVFDQYVGQQDPSTGQTATAVAIGMNQAQGQIQGNRVYVLFQDAAGVIAFDGTISGSTYSGQMSYQNNRNVNGGPGAMAQPMGNFQIPTCQFFVCN